MKELLTDLQRKALEAVELRGATNPVTGKELAESIGLKPRPSGKPGADMRAIVNALRVKGYPICASGDGYWWPADRRELSAYIESFEGRVSEQQRALDGLRRGYDKVGVPVSQTIREEAAAASRGGVYVIRRKWPEEDSHVLVKAEGVDAFLAAHPDAVKYGA